MMVNVSRLLLLLIMVYAVLSMLLFWNMASSDTINGHMFQDFLTAFMMLMCVLTSKAWNLLIVDCCRLYLWPVQLWPT